MRSEASRDSHGSPDGVPADTAQVQPEDDKSTTVSRGLPEIAEIHFAGMGRTLFRRMGHPLVAESNRADEEVAEKVRRHQPLLLNWFKARGNVPGGAVERLNGKAKLSMRNAYGYKSLKVAQVALSHTRKSPDSRIYRQILVKSPLHFLSTSSN